MNPTETGPSASDIELRKLALRDQLVTARGRMPLADLAERGTAIAGALLETPEVRRAATVAAYVSVVLFGSMPCSSR